MPTYPKKYEGEGEVELEKIRKRKRRQLGGSRYLNWQKLGRGQKKRRALTQELKQEANTLTLKGWKKQAGGNTEDGGSHIIKVVWGELKRQTKKENREPLNVVERGGDRTNTGAQA